MDNTVDARLSRKYPVFAEVRKTKSKDKPGKGKYGNPSAGNHMYQFHTVHLPEALGEVDDSGKPRHVYIQSCAVVRRTTVATRAFSAS